jgi:hypothetical protein
MLKPLTIALLTLATLGCEKINEVKEQMAYEVGDQQFRSAIAIIELHKVRYGEYPESTSDLRFLGELDQKAIGAVTYQRMANGYRLDYTNGTMGEIPDLSFATGFREGLGLRVSNVFD